MMSLAALLGASAAAASLPFIPDVTFEGSTLKGWHVVGQAEWRAENGELIGKAKNGGGGWLVLDKSFQDVGLHAMVQCTGDCKTGVMVRSEVNDNGAKGAFFSLAEGDIGARLSTFDGNGQEVDKTEMGRSFGIERVAPPPNPDAGARRGFRGFGRRGPQVELPVTRESTDYQPGQWNQIDITIDANILRPAVNGGRASGGVTPDDGNGFGPVALYVAGSGEVHFKNVGYKDLSLRTLPKNEVGSQFREQCINDWYFAWSASTADFNRDGITDIVAGPYVYYGPDYTTSREIYLAAALSPAKNFTEEQIEFAHDFTGDGWPDILVGPAAPLLYVNPKGEPRRWEKREIIAGRPQSELTVLDDLNGDGMPEWIYSGAGRVRYAGPDPANPNGMWIEHDVSEQGYGSAHGLGVGDVNGDGRPDILNMYGWWEQPATGADQGPWPYHMQAFTHAVNGAGGAGIFVVDANGDGLNDVVTSVNAHTFGLAWYEQKKDGSFVEHMIAGDFGSKDNAGGVVFSEPHGTGFGDIDGDGIGDFVVGKRSGAHLDSYLDPDPYGAPVLYWYQTVRNPNAPGGAEFVPHLINNRSGAGSNVFVGDINKDGAVDVVTSTNRGTFIFWNVGKGRATSDD